MIQVHKPGRAVPNTSILDDLTVSLFDMHTYIPHPLTDAHKPYTADRLSYPRTDTDRCKVRLSLVPLELKNLGYFPCSGIQFEFE